MAAPEAFDALLSQLADSSAAELRFARQLQAQRNASSEIVDKLALLVKDCYSEQLALPENAELAVSFAWDCSTSPVKGCVYDIENDPAEDACLFCGDPNERK